MRTLVLSLSILAAMPTHGAWSQSRPATVGVITNPDWASRPNGEDLSSAYPTVAAWLGIEGRALMECEVDDLGRLRRCVILEELPAGLGFGAATVSIASSFQMQPRRVDGRPIAGGKVRIPLNWALPAVEEQTAPRADSSVDTIALSLGRRIASAQDWTGQASASVQSQFEYFRTLNGNRYANDPTIEREAVEAHEDAIVALGGRRNDVVAQLLAKRLSTDQLAAAALFYESGPGRAMSKLVSTNLDAGPDDNALWSSLDADVFKEARRRFCLKRSCEVKPVSAKP